LILRVAIAGAGGHAKAVADALILEGKHDLVGFLDDAPELMGHHVWEYPVLGRISSWPRHGLDGLVLAIGDNVRRKALYDSLRGDGAQMVVVQHPHSTVARSATLGDGAVMLAQSVVNPDSRIGANVILNTASTVDHDCDVGAHAHLAPGVHLAGGIRVGEGAFLGTGALILPGIEIGAWAIIGAGAVVVRDVMTGSTIIGVPGRER